MSRENVRSWSFSYPTKDWRGVGGQSFFGYDTDYEIELCCLRRLYSVVGVIPTEGLAGPRRPILLLLCSNKDLKACFFSWHSSNEKIIYNVIYCPVLHKVFGAFSPLHVLDILIPTGQFHCKMSGKYQTFCWTLSLIYSCRTKCLTRSNPLPNIFKFHQTCLANPSKDLGHLWLGYIRKHEKAGTLTTECSLS